MTQKIPRPNPAMLALARDLNDMKRRIREMETASQAGFTSVEGRTLDFYDPDTDQLLGSIGLQKDGTFGFNRVGGAKPEAPTEPDVQPIPGGAIVAWDGRFEDAQSMLNIDRIAVHMDETAGFPVTRDTEVAAIYSHTGGTAVIPIDDGTDWYVKLVAVTKGQVWSDPSTEVHVASVDANIGFYQDEFTLTVDGAQDLVLSFEPISFSEHLYWNGLYQREDVDWARIGQTISLAIDDAEVGDVIAVEYAYLEDDTLSVGWMATGWRYLLVAETDTTDRSGTGFDDSAWDAGQGAFGNTIAADGTPFNTSTLGWPAPTTVIPVNTGIWLRRPIDELPANPATVTVKVRVDGDTTVYWNGTQIATRSASGTIEVANITVPTNLLGGTNLLAIHHVDDAGDPSYDFIYIDARIEWTE